MRVHHRVILLVAVSSLLTPRAGDAVETESVLSRNQKVIHQLDPSKYRWGPKAKSDTVEGLTAEDAKLCTDDISSANVEALLERYLDRIAEDCYAKRGFPDNVKTFLEKDEMARLVFLSALDPRYDDYEKAAEVMGALLEHDERTVAKYIHLATAMAVVWDDPAKVCSSRYSLIYGTTKEQFPPLPSYMDNWTYYTDKRRGRAFGFALDRLPWSILVHLVDNDTTSEERSWARGRYSARGKLGKLYQTVPYDYDKRNRTGTKLGSTPYTLPNVLKFGGVCGDQAHFTSRAGKCLGIPAMKVRGKGRYGGAGGHAWAGYLVITSKGRPLLEFTGRYFYDYYYTGDIYDPQTGTLTLDRFVAMMYDGASLSYPKYNQSQMLVRMAEAARKDYPKESLQLTQKALRLNYFNMWGWPLLMAHIKDGTLDRKDGLSWFNAMTKSLRAHPDMTFHCLRGFVSLIPAEELAKRQSLYNQAFRLYRDRPDLQIKLRIAQSKDLIAGGKKPKAINLLAPTVVKNAKEGALVLPAVELCVEIAKELGCERQVHGMLKQADRQFPKMRGTTPSKAYAQFEELLQQLQ